ncbi:helix-turn-helix domain-containing protein [Streptomyces sp. NPDC059564]|uniref:helix-turn-helix domain-containing protein n=1 Tax=Streptomyces sp. NPDC059564 TaxID=3346865 RepID=UPI0036AC5582
MLSRGLSILRCFRPGEQELQLSELARRADMPKATAHRIVVELVKEGMLERGENGLRLGVALFVLGTRVPRQLELRDLALPYAQQLRHLTQGSVFVFISDVCGAEAALVDAVRRVPGGGDARGAEEENRASALAAARLFHAYGARAALPARREPVPAEDPARVQAQGFVVVRSRTGAVSIAAPVLNASSAAVGALAVAGPDGRVQPVKAAWYLQAACAAVSRSLRRTPECVPAW